MICHISKHQSQDDPTTIYVRIPKHGQDNRGSTPPSSCYARHRRDPVLPPTNTVDLAYKHYNRVMKG